MVVEALIFDLGMTLLTEGEPTGRHKWQMKLGLPEGEFEHLVVAELQSGWNGSRTEEEIVSALRQATGLGPLEAVAMLEDFYADTRLDPDLTKFLERARVAYRVAVLSNAGPGMRAAMVRRFDLANRVDLMVISGEEGIEKPDPAIYIRTAERLGVDPARCLFVDDSPINVSGAIAVGMMAILHEDAERTLLAIRGALGMVEKRYRAAGGVVFRGGEVLIRRNDTKDEWRLPKGHVESGETDEETALREVTEETGYADLVIDGDLGRQRIVYDKFDSGPPGSHVDRGEHHFRMRLASDRCVPRPPGDEHAEPRWIPIDEARVLLTFGAEREWLERAVSLTS